MSININNSLTCVDFRLDQRICDLPSLLMLVDSGVAINIVNKPHHRSIISRFPNFVAEYIKYGSDTKYNQVQFKIAVTQSTLEGQFNNGTLSTIIRYNLKINSQHLILSFPLGDTIDLRTIWGTSSLEGMHGVLDLCNRKLTLEKLQIELPLIITEPNQGYFRHVNLSCIRISTPPLMRIPMVCILWQIVALPSSLFIFLTLIV